MGFPADIVGNRNGSTAIVAGLAMPVLIAAVMLSVDYATTVAARESLQAAADTGAIAGARELTVLAASRGPIAEEAAAAIATRVAERISLKAGTLAVEAAFNEDAGHLTVRITGKPTTILAESLTGAAPEVSVRAVAQPVGDSSLCVIGLAGGGVSLQGGANSGIVAQGCVVYANSTSPQSLTLTQRATIAAERVCTGGGYRGRTDAVTPSPTLDCPQVKDPLLERPRPPSDGCTHVGRSLNHKADTWSPGVYCGGIYLNNGARLRLEPGVYVLKGGTLNVEGGAKLEGEGVTLFLTAGARLNVLQGSHLELSAPAYGATAGMLIFGDETKPPLTAHVFRSDNARLLLGTIYLPESTLRIGGSKPIADQSPWTAIVAGRVQLEGNAQVVLNSHFDETPVPLPTGLAGLARDIRLTQ